LFSQNELKKDIQDIKEKVIRLEEGQKNLEKRMDGLETRMDKRFDELKNDLQGFMFWGFGVLFSGMFILVGFILWDRRTTLAPVAREQKYIQAEIDEWKKKEKTIIEVLKKYAENDPKLKEILDKAALF
jgi:DNA repair exonuclease SbcCD ATPase subunit